MSSKVMLVWRFQDAPPEYHSLCKPEWLNGADGVRAQWLLYQPPACGGSWLGFADSDAFGSERSEHSLPDGGNVIIGAHDRWSPDRLELDLPVDPSRVIRVWDYGDARQDPEAQCPYVDDADWVAHVPADLVNADIAWMASGSNFGCCTVDVDPLPQGGEIRIGTHG